MVLLDRSKVLRHLIRIKHQDQVAAPVTLVVAEQIHQHVPRRIQTVPSDSLELVPRKNDVVPVDQHKLLRGLHLRQKLPLILRAKRHHGKHVSSFDLPIRPLENRQQLLFKLRRAARGD